MKREIYIAGFFLLVLLLVSGCGSSYTPPNEDACVRDSEAGAPVHEHCTYTIQGNDFQIGLDSNGSGTYYNYTLWGQNITADQYDQDAIRFSPWAYSDMRQNWLTYCHSNASDCTYSTAVQMTTAFEESLHMDRNLVPMWNDSMLKDK